MQLVLDGKSLAIGVFAGASLVAGLGAMQAATPEIGRFRIVASGASAGHEIEAFVLDTATGQVWRSNHRNEWLEKKLQDGQ